MTASAMVSPLAGLRDDLARAEELTGGRLRLRELPFTTMLDVRLDPADAGLVDRLESALGVPWPVAPNHASSAGDRRVVWLGPDEWLVLGPPASESRLAGELADAAGDAWVTVTDVSAQRTTIELGGALAREVLMTGCSLDLDALVPGRCAQTLLARAGVVIVPVGEEGFALLVRSSFATYLAMWLLDAAREHHVRCRSTP